MNIVKRNQYKNTVISVTGSCGKTTVCKMIYDIMNNYTTIDKTHENSNSFLGIPWCINKLFNLNSKYWLIEIGISHKDEMTRLINMVNPDIRAITNIGIAHTGNFIGGHNDYINEKLNFVRNLPINSTLIINNDDIILSNFKYQDNIKIIRCGTKPTDDIQLISYYMNNDNMTSNLEIKINNNCSNNYLIKIKMNGLGKYNALNMCIAIGCTLSLSIPVTVIRNKLNNFIFYENRGEIICNNTRSYNIFLYNYSYNCAFTSIINNLDEFNKIKSSNRIIILGDMMELDNPLYYHDKILSTCINITLNNNILVYSTNYYKYTIYRKPELYKGMHIFDNINNIINMLDFIIKANNCDIYIFVQGSNNSRLYQVANFVKNIRNNNVLYL